MFNSISVKSSSAVQKELNDTAATTVSTGVKAAHGLLPSLVADRLDGLWFPTENSVHIREDIYTLAMDGLRNAETVMAYVKLVDPFKKGDDQIIVVDILFYERARKKGPFCNLYFHYRKGDSFPCDCGERPIQKAVKV